MTSVGPPTAGTHPIPDWLKGYPLTGPFISGSTHRVLVFGQNPSDAEDGEGRVPTARKSGLKTRSSGPAAASEASGSASRTWPVSLADLVSAGLLIPGPGALSVVYKGSTHSAALLPDGSINYDGKAYGSASAFSIHVKRLITPDKQGDDGWKSVLYMGKPLDVFRRQLRDTMSEAVEGASEASDDERTGGEGAGELTSRPATAPTATGASSASARPRPDDARSDAEGEPPGKRARRSGEGSATGPGSRTPVSGRPPPGRRAPPSSSTARQARSRLGRGAAVAAPGPTPSTSAGAADGEDQPWVQCDACGTWRAVPDKATAAALVGAGDAAAWHCRDATWDVETMAPGTPACGA